MPQLRQLIVVDDGIADLDLPARLGQRIEQVAFRPDRRPHHGDQFLADGIERRIGDLREELLEVVVEQARAIRQHRQRGVGAHRADRLLAAGRHRRQQDPEIFLRIAEPLLASQHGLVADPRQIRGRRQIVDVDEVLGQPAAVGLSGGELALDLLVRHDPAPGRVHQEDAPRMHPFLEENVLGRNVEHADLRRHDHQIVLRHVIPRRPEAVAVEHGADHRAVGEGDRRGPIPRLHQRRVVLVEGLDRRIHGRIARPRLGNHHEQGVGQGSPRHHEELQHVVEGRGVAAALADDRQNLAEVLPERVRAQEPLARPHPVDVAAQRVDFAVVRDVPIRVRQRPRRKRIRAEALVHERKRRLDVGIDEIRERRSDLVGGQHPFVDERLRREAREIERVSLDERQPVGRVLGALADDVQLALEPHRIGGRDRGPGPFPDEQLFDDRRGRDGRRPEPAQVGRDRTPPEHVLPFFTHDLLEEAADPIALAGVLRQEHQAGAVAAFGGQREPERGGHLPEEPVGDLNQDARAVAGVGLAAAGAAVQQIDQQLQSALDDRMRAPPLDVGDEADAAGVMLVPRVVEAVSGGRAAGHAVGNWRVGMGRHGDPRPPLSPVPN